MPKSEKKKKSSSKRPPAEEEVEDLTGAMPAADEDADVRAAARVQKKKQKKAVEPEPEQEEEPEEDGDTTEEKAAKKLRRQREHKKVSGYRNKAKECGFTSGGGVIGAMGLDSFAAALTPADAKRLMRFVPEVLNKSSFDKPECMARMKLSAEPVPASAARETQARCEAVFRKIMNEAVLRTAEKGVARVDAATMQSVLRPYQYGMAFSAVLPPKGLVRHAQGEGVLSASVGDEAVAESEKTENRELAATAKRLDKAEEERKEAFKARREALMAQKTEKA